MWPGLAFFLSLEMAADADPGGCDEQADELEALRAAPGTEHRLDSMSAIIVTSIGRDQERLHGGSDI